MLAAVILTKNEERNLARCLESVQFCDEIVVVDSGSTDQTVEIARRYTSKIRVIPWKGFIAQRNEAVRYVEADWILSIDADEEVPPALREEILEVLKTNPTETAFRLSRRTIHFGRWIRYGGWYPNRLTRLFRKDCGSWKGSELHEYWETSGTVKNLRADLLHYSFEDLADQVQRNNSYSSLGAVQLRKKGIRFSAFRLLTKPLVKFFETYFLKQGFRDGFAGFIIAVSAAYSVFLKWAKLWELENGGKSKG